MRFGRTGTIERGATRGSSRRSGRGLAGTATVLALLVGTLAGAAGAGPARADITPLLPGPQGWAVSLGDSYISGEGGRWAGNINAWAPTSLVDRLGPTAYFDNPTGTAELIKNCHRSKSAEIHIGVLQSKNLACSGAETASMIDSDGNYKPGIDFVDLGNGVVGQAQMLQDFATAHPRDSGTPIRLVALSIGGNDFGFTELVRTCIEDFLTPIVTRYCKDRFSPTDLDALATLVADRVPTAIAHVHQAMAAAGYAQSDWTLVVQNYPSPLPPGGTGDGQFRYTQSGYTRATTGSCPFWDVDATWANQDVLPRVNDAVATAIATARTDGAANIQALDLSSAFDGNRLCERNDATDVRQVQDLPRPSGAPYPTKDVLFSRAEYFQGVHTGLNPLRPFDQHESMHPSYLAQMGLRNCLRQAWENDSGGRCVAGARTGLPVSIAEPPMNLVQTRPRSVQDVLATPDDASVRVSWDPDPAGAPATYFAVQLCEQNAPSACTTATVAAPGTETVVAGLTNGTAYTARVAATGVYGTSAPTAARGPVTPSANVAEEPDHVQVRGDDQVLGVSWQRPSGGEPGEGYEVSLYESEGSPTPLRTEVVPVADPPSASYALDLDGLVNGTPLWAQVTAVSGGARTAAPRVPGTPKVAEPTDAAAVVAASSDGAAALAWGAPLGGGAVEQYRVLGYDDADGVPVQFGVVPATAPKSASRSAPTFGLTIGGLANGHTYRVAVVAENDAGTSVSEWHELSPRAVALTPPPGQPTTPTDAPSTPTPTPTPTGPPGPGPSVTVVSPTDGSAISSGAWFGVSARTGGVPPGATAYVTIDGIAVASTTVTAEGSARFDKVPARTGGYAVRIGPAPATVVSAGWAMDIRPFGITGHRDLGSTVRFTVATGNFSPGTAVRLTRDGRTTAIGRVPTSGSSLGITVPDARGTYQVKVDSRQGWVYGLPAGVTRLP